MPNRFKGVTLLELMIVVVIIGILAALAIPNYTIAVEKSRSIEARQVLRQIRDVQRAYYLERDRYATSFNDISVAVNTATCAAQSTYYFNYTMSGNGALVWTATAMRCATGGKIPPAAAAYNLSMVCNSTTNGTLVATDNRLL